PTLDAEAALLPPGHRLTFAQRRLALRNLTLDEHHPLTRRCPDSFHQMAEGISEEDLGGACWDEQESSQSRYPNSLVRLLSTLKNWIKPASKVETVNGRCEVEPAGITFHLSKSDKGKAAEEHKRLIASLDDSNAVVYSDGSLLEGTVGAGIYLRGSNQRREERHSLHLGTKMEVYDAELVGISYATSILVSRNLRPLDILSVALSALWSPNPSRGFAG